MDIRECCPLCSHVKGSIIQTLKIDQHFINFIETYYGDQSFNLISKFIKEDIQYFQCDRCDLIYQKNILLI